MPRIKKICKTNKEALRWCKSRRAIIKFIKDDNQVLCVILIDKMYQRAKTLIQVVNKYIEIFNQEN